MSTTQIDRLGDRLRKGDVSDDDLKLLEDYRGSFSEAFELIDGKIRRVLELDPTARPRKSTESIIYKLQRETIRLSQMQDIAGCRITAPEIYTQDAYVMAISNLFEADNAAFTIADRRINPSYGYRAVHVVARVMERNIEIQIRTELQHVWAELCEALADTYGPEVKYGGGEPLLRDTLEVASAMVADHEVMEGHLLRAAFAMVQRNDPDELDETAFLREAPDRFRKSLLEKLRNVVKKIEDNDILNSI